MHSSASHRLFGIPELLEKILLQVHLPTLLTSAQRVCRMWHRVIQDSSALQKALFFKPSEKQVDPEERHINPFVESNLWPGLFRKGNQIHECRLAHGVDLPHLPLLEPHEEEVYLRREASWRRMLLQQPPSNNIAIVTCGYGDNSTRLCHLQVALKPHTNCRRLGDLYSGIEKGIVLPAQIPFVFCVTMTPSSKIPDPERRYPWSTVPISKFLIDCDVVFFHKAGEPIVKEGWEKVKSWLFSLGEIEPTVGGDRGDFPENWFGCYQQLIRNTKISFRVYRQRRLVTSLSM